jgi:GST-like protein
MLTFYTYPGPNARKAKIMLEESGLPYQSKLVDIEKREQFDPAFLAISPGNKIPAIVDTDANGQSTAVFETGAIMIHLAEKCGRLLPTFYPDRSRTLAWLVWSVTGLGSTLPQVHYFGDRADETPPAVLDRFVSEAVRLFHLLEKRLSESEYLMKDYSIADIPTFASTVGMLAGVKRLSNGQLMETPSIDRWIDAINARPAVQRALAN